MNKMEITLYKIEEECTSGWVEVATSLTKEECLLRYEEMLNEGTSPKRLKIVKIQ
tara:strand:+ start:667 stop:831 length:165 start_codon:yes stop_codon:yes gene_type:complete